MTQKPTDAKVRKQRRRKLYNLTAQEVSLVYEPANLKRMLVLKAKGKRMNAAAQQVQQAMETADAGTIARADEVVDDLAVRKAATVPGLPPPAPPTAPVPPTGAPVPPRQGDGLSEQAQAALKAVARILAPYANEITFSDLDALQESLGMVNDEAGDEPDPEEADNAKAPKKEPGMGDTKVTKSAGGENARLEEVFKRAAALEAQNVELVAKSAKLAAELEVEREDRLTREYQAKAAQYSALGDTATMAKILKRMHGADAAQVEEFEAVLKAADARVKAAQEFGGLYGEIGSSQSGGAGGATAEAKLDALVDGIVQKSASGKTREQIYSEMLKTPEGRALYRQSQVEKGYGVR